MINQKAAQDAETEAMAELSEELVVECSKILAGHPPEVQSAALGDLVAIWLAGFEVLPSVHAEAFREARLAAFVTLVRNLVEPNVQIKRRVHRRRTG